VSDAEPALDAPTARAVLLVRAFDTAEPPSPAWSEEDNAWATRLARDTVPASAGPAAFLAARARHALKRLEPRSAEVAAALAAPTRPWPGWVAWLPALALLAGGLAERIAPAQRIELLASPVWVLLGWNLVVYLWLAWRALGGVAPGGRPRWGEVTVRTPDATPLQRYASSVAAGMRPARWAAVSALLHTAAAAFAIGLVAGLYLRGLVLDYRAGWQSTFLDAAQVHALLSRLLAPAAALSGVVMPDPAAVAAMQIGPGGQAPAPAAPWIHLLAATLGLFVVLPRCLLAAAATWQCRRRLAAIPLPIGEPYFEQLLRQREGRRAVVQVLPAGLPAQDRWVPDLHRFLAPRWGADVELRVIPTLPLDDDDTPPPTAPGDIAERVVLFDLTSTPEDEVHGRLVDRLLAATPAVPLTLGVDESAFVARFATTPQRIEQRRALWRDFAARHGAALVLLPLPPVAVA